MGLCTYVYCKVPRLLRNSSEIYKFMEPFAAFSFKKLRRFMREAMDFHLRPHIRDLVDHFTSKKCWTLKHERFHYEMMEREKRVGLYRAMLRHKRFPNYFPYKENYCSHPKFIDYFEFVVPICLEPEPLDEAAIREAQKEECEEVCAEKLPFGSVGERGTDANDKSGTEVRPSLKRRSSRPSKISFGYIN